MFGQCKVHANGLCTDYREPSRGELEQLRRRVGAGPLVPAPTATPKPDWRASVAAAEAAKGGEVVSVDPICAHPTEVEIQNDLPF